MVSRRAFLRGTFRGRSIAAAATGGVACSYVLDHAKGAITPPRPPGALAEGSFVASCIKCGQCVEACPFGTLKLAGPTDEVAAGTPYFSPRDVPCEMCEDAPCIQQCPTGTLVKGTKIRDAQMGLAVLTDHENCLAYKGLRCEACFRACPVMGEAISLDLRPQQRTGKHAFFLPVVHSDACTGCGKCEHACVMEQPAIRVFPRADALGKVGDHYRFGWTEEAVISKDFQVAPAPVEPAWEKNLDNVLDEMDDLSGIEEGTW